MFKRIAQKNSGVKCCSGELAFLNQQFIVCYDIENSVIYELFVDTENGIVISDQTRTIREAIARKVGQLDDKFIHKDNLKKAQEIVDVLNEKTGTHFILGALTHKYLSNFYIYNNKTKEIISKFAVTVEEDNKIFEELVDMWRKGADILFTAHNLDYEYSYIRYNTNFLSLLETNSKKTSIIANGTHDIKSLEFVDGDIEEYKGKQYINHQRKFLIRDSYLMTGKSIKKLGDAYGMPKLEYDYEVTRLSKEDLTEEDYKYNQRDNEIALKAILEIQQQQEIYSDITRLPVSATQHSRVTCEQNPVVNPYDEKNKRTLSQLHIKLSPTFNMPNAELFNKFYNASGGGLIGVNPLETSKWQSGVYSFDMKSAHPSQIFNKRYPMGDTTTEVPKEYFNDVIRELKFKAKLMQRMPKKFYNTFCPEYDFLILCELKGVKEKEINGNIINSLSAGQYVQSKETAVTNRVARNIGGISLHGKVRSSQSYTKWFYGIDLIYHLSFYDVEEINIIECYQYSMANCDEYLVKQFEFYGESKEVYKSFTKQSSKLNFPEMKEIVQNSTAEAYTKNALRPEDYDLFLNNELLRIKGIFNGLFGQQYQSPIHNNMLFNTSDNYSIAKAETKEYEESIKKTSIHYCVGAYIALWSRFELACMIWHVIQNGGKVFYFATDSVKCNGVSESVFDNWSYGHTTTYYSRNKWNFGAIDCENRNNPMEFFTPETLKHIDICRDEKNKDKIKINCTVSGFKASVYLKDFLQEWNYEIDEDGKVLNEGKEYTPENIEEAKRILTEKFKPQYIPPELTGKIIREQMFAGVKTGLKQISFGALQPVGYNLGGINEECIEYKGVD